MGFFTRLIAGLVAASTLGAGLAGTAGAVDTTGTTEDAKDVVKLASADTSGLPDHLVNGDFQTYGNQIINLRASGSRYLTLVDGQGNVMKDGASHPWTKFNGWNATNFAWESNDSYGTHSSLVELQRSEKSPTPTSAGNVWGEIAAATEGKYIYQDIATTPGVMYKWSLKHASRRANSDDTMQVKIGDPGKTVAQQATRTTSNGSDKTGSVGTAITTHGTAQDGKWETYSGTYIATSTVTRFTFKSLRGSQNGDGVSTNAEGNCIDDVMFTKAYKLSYDKNATDANGSVPSDETAGATKQAKSKPNGSVRLAADDDVAEYAANGLPEQIVNGGFDYPSVPSWTALPESASNKFNKGKRFATINPGTGKYGSGCAMSTTGRAIPNWNRLNFAWSSTQGDTHYSGGMSCEAGNVELNYDSVHHNQFAELTADQQGTAIYQDVKVTPGTMMKWSLKHSGATSAYVDKMQVMIGEPYKETAQEATRITSENGNKVGEKMTTISTPTTSDRADNKKWDTYSGTYLVPDGVTTVRFTFKSVASAEWYSGNDLDDIEFSRSYKLTYDKNSSDAAGEVPSNQRGKENTVQPAKAKTTGTVKTVADGDSSKSLTVNPGFDVPDYSKLDDGGLHWMYVSPAEGKAWSYYDYINPAQPKHQVAGLSQATFGWQELTGGDYKTTLFELHREKDGNVCADVHGSRTIGQTIDTQAGVAYTVSIRHSGRSKGNAGSVQVLVGPDKNHLRPLEMSRMNVSRTGAKYGDRTGKVGTVITTHSDSVDSTEGDHPAWDHSDDWETYSGTYVATGGKTVFAYRGVDKNGNAVSGNDSAADSVIDDLSFKLAYPLAYDKNAQDATGSVPSDMAANTTRPAKSETDGKVSDLVQRTTTHEDGSVTVRTVDQSTDVVSGCQVYYPAGQRITLATLAKDGDCWDSSMLTRPGHTQLGWSQDSQATQAQAEVTMVEGGMTVYAVWVGNPVLTYDTNKPNTWNGQMPSTPASVSVPYDTAAADGSGWQSGDTSKIRGYRFLGWYAGPQDDAGLYDWNTLLTGNVTVYAHWERLKASVVYDRNAKDAKGSHANTSGWQYSDVTVPSDTSKSFKRAGYVFLGWDTQADGNGTAYKDGSQVPLQDKDITLYAQWQPVFEQFTPTGGVSLPLLVAGGVTLLVMGIGSTVMLTRRMRGER